MKKISLILLSMLLFTLVAGSYISRGTTEEACPILTDEESYNIIRDMYVGMDRPGSSGYDTWKEGLKKEYGLELKTFTYNIEFILTEKSEYGVAVGYIITIIAYCHNRHGEKSMAKRVTGLVALIDPKIRAVVDTFIIQQSGISIIGGWNGKDC